MYSLDEFQQAAVDNGGNTLVVAGPGSGKTRTLLARAEQCRQPLVLTFTRGAAYKARGMTFHSFCHSLIGGEVWDRQRQLSEMTKICREMNMKDYSIPTTALKEISWRKCSGMKVADTPWNVEYEKRKGGASDFGDLLIRGLDYVSNMNISSRYGAVLVDEFQDLNPLQYAILGQITRKNVFAVGDPYQSIYAWRDAHPTIFDEFKKDFHPEEFELLNDYRHGPEILACLEWLFPRGLIPKGPPGKAEMFECITPEAEMALVLRLTRELGEVDILCRRWNLLRHLINYGVKGSLISDPENEHYDYTGEGDIKMYSIHSTKGLEFPTTLLVGCSKAWSSDMSGAEERRVLYVGMARAMRSLLITAGGSTSLFFVESVGGNGPFPAIPRKFWKNGNRLVEVK